MKVVDFGKEGIKQNAAFLLIDNELVIIL